MKKWHKVYYKIPCDPVTYVQITSDRLLAKTRKQIAKDNGKIIKIMPHKINLIPLGL